MTKKSDISYREQFDVQYSEVSTEDIQKEILYNLKLSNEISEKTRANTQSLITWLIVIPLVVGLAIMVMSTPEMK